jgi:hypothetical protein
MKAINATAKEPKRKLGEELSKCGFSSDMAELLGAIKSALGRATLVPPCQWRKLLNLTALACGFGALDHITPGTFGEADGGFYTIACRLPQRIGDL